MGTYTDDSSHVNLTETPIVCAIVTDRPLPADAWLAVSSLAHAVHKASVDLRRLMNAQVVPGLGPDNKQSEGSIAPSNPAHADAVGSSSGAKRDRGRG